MAPCHTVVWGGALATTQSRRAYVPNHCGFGVVEEIGPDVKRVQVGDRVIVAGTSQCGVCYQCLHGRPGFVKLIEKGRLDAKSMIIRTYRLADGRQAVQDVADRTVITAVILFE